MTWRPGGQGELDSSGAHQGLGLLIQSRDHHHIKDVGGTLQL
jgi:hypothetical protein